MSEEAKGVTVTLAESQQVVTHPEAHHLDVEGGHLLVKTARGDSARVVAMYAPGYWRDAVVNR